MEQKFFDAVNGVLSEALLEAGFTFADGAFTGDALSFRVAYNDEGKVFVLEKASVSEGTVGEYAAVTTYLFDEESTLSDAEAVGIDFADTARNLLGLGRRRVAAAIQLPKKSDSQNPGIEDLTSKLLAIFPKHKDSYKEHVEEYGEFLYVNFFLETFTLDLREMLDSGNDKKLRKTCDALNELYCKGDRSVSDAVVVVLLGGAVAGDAARAERLLSALANHQFLKPAVHNIIKRTAHDKKLREIYGL